MDEDEYFDYWWNDPVTAAPVGAIDTSGNSAFLGYQVGNPGTANPVPTSEGFSDAFYTGGDPGSSGGILGSVGDAFGSVFDSITGAIGSAAQNVLANAGNAAVSGIVNAGNQGANAVNPPRPNTGAQVSGMNSQTVVLVSVVAVAAVVLAVVLSRRK